MDIREYQHRARKTARPPGKGISPLVLWRLGLYGEVGSALQELKKRDRDGDAYTGFKENLSEELGDVLWYTCALVSEHLVEVAEPPSFAPPCAPEDVLFALHEAAVRLGQVAAAPDARQDEVRARAMATLAELARSAAVIGRSLGELAADNLTKVERRWMGDASSSAPRFDGDSDETESLPRQILVEFRERRVGAPTVLLRVNGLNVGDRLTDNSYVDDGYRFHDAFHLGYAAVLGWSPVTRALLKVKRKSHGKKDEVEDGARAQIIEEAIAFQVYDYARRLRFLEGIHRIDQALLKRIMALVSGLEVEQCAPWEWELAILRGYEAFRKLKATGGGRVQFDMDRRALEVVP